MGLCFEAGYELEWTVGHEGEGGNAEFLYDGPGSTGPPRSGERATTCSPSWTTSNTPAWGSSRCSPSTLRDRSRSPSPRRPCARLRCVRAGVAHSPHCGGAGWLACELLSGRHRRSGRQRRPRALQRLARRREPVLRRGGTDSVKARRQAFLAGVLDHMSALRYLVKVGQFLYLAVVALYTREVCLPQ